jgi:putative copper export protein
MDVLLVVLLVGAGGAGYLTAVWLSTESRPIRHCAIWAVIGSIVLGIAAILTTACSLAENRSELYYERCEGSVPTYCCT